MSSDDSIRRYLEGSLSAAERSAFEDEMRHNKRLRRRIESHSLYSRDLQRRQSTLAWILRGLIVASVSMIGAYIYVCCVMPQHVMPNVRHIYRSALGTPSDTATMRPYMRAALKAYYGGDSDRAMAMLRSIDRDSAAYWLAEMHMSEGAADSSLAYLPHLYEPRELRQRIDYLRILALYSLGDPTYQLEIDLKAKLGDTSYHEAYALISR